MQGKSNGKSHYALVREAAPFADASAEVEPHNDQRGHSGNRKTCASSLGLTLSFMAFWLAQLAIDTSNAACPPYVTISDINHGAGGPECGKSMLYWLFAVVSLFASAWAILAWLALWIMSLLAVVRK